MFACRYYNGRDSRSVVVECDVVGATLWIRLDGHDERIELAQIRVSPRLARTQRTLFLPGGAQIQTDDNDAVDAAFPSRNRIESFADRLERHWRAVVASVVISVAVAIAFFPVLPWMADRIARKVPESVEAAMGDQAMSLLRRYALEPSKLSAEKQTALRARFSAFTADISDAVKYRVEFFAAPAIGANAFALPGGMIVFTDDMINLLDNDDEFLAVAAHEIGHEQHRHLLRSVLQNSAVIVVAAAFAGDVGSASTVVVAIPAFLLQNHYSRDFEADADDYALAALEAHGISPTVFADVMRKFERKYPGMKDGVMAYASSHPPTDDRIRRAEEAAKAFSKP